MSTCVILSLGGGVFDQLPRKNRETIRDKLPPYEGDIVLPSTLLTRTKAPGCYILPSCWGHSWEFSTTSWTIKLGGWGGHSANESHDVFDNLLFWILRPSWSSKPYNILIAPWYPDSLRQKPGWSSSFWRCCHAKVLSSDPGTRWCRWTTHQFCDHHGKLGDGCIITDKDIQCWKYTYTCFLKMCWSGLQFVLLATVIAVDILSCNKIYIYIRMSCMCNVLCMRCLFNIYMYEYLYIFIYICIYNYV